MSDRDSRLDSGALTSPWEQTPAALNDRRRADPPRQVTPMTLCKSYITPNFVAVECACRVQFERVQSTRALWPTHKLLNAAPPWPSSLAIQAIRAALELHISRSACPQLACGGHTETQLSHALVQNPVLSPMLHQLQFA